MCVTPVMWKRLLAIAVVATASTCGPANRPETLPAPATAHEPAAAAPAHAVVERAKAIAAPALIATPLADDPTKTTIHRLSNGMTVYLSPDAQEPSVVAHIAVRAGGGSDPQQSTG